MKRVIIDTDPGIDDAAAIFLALGSPELQVDALTTVFGNTAVEQCTVNALRILEAARRADANGARHHTIRNAGYTIPGQPCASKSSRR